MSPSTLVATFRLFVNNKHTRRKRSLVNNCFPFRQFYLYYLLHENTLFYYCTSSLNNMFLLVLLENNDIEQCLLLTNPGGYDKINKTICYAKKSIINWKGKGDNIAPGRFRQTFKIQKCIYSLWVVSVFSLVFHTRLW